MSHNYRQNKGTKMSLSQFANLNLESPKPSKNRFPIIEQQRERIPVVPFSELMKQAEEETIKNNNKFGKFGKANFRNGQRLDLDIKTPGYETLETYELSYDNEFDLRKLRESKFREKPVVKETQNRWKESLDFDNMRQEDINTYRNVIKSRNEKMFDSMNVGDSELYLKRAPDMGRVLFLTEILRGGFEVETTKDGTIVTESNFPKFLTPNDASFKFSKNGQHLFCDVRPTFMPNINEVQIYTYGNNGNIVLLGIVDMLIASQYITDLFE